MEQNEVTRCFQCGSVSSHVHAFARLSDKEAFLGVTTRSVCDNCLDRYIDRVKDGKKDRFTFLWPLIVLSFIGLLMHFTAEKAGYRTLGVLIVLLGITIAGIAIYQQRKECTDARAASVEENRKKFSSIMCRENANKAGTQNKLVEMKLEYALDEYTIERIGKEAGVSLQTATLMKAIVLKAVVDTIGKQASN